MSYTLEIYSLESGVFTKIDEIITYQNLKFFYKLNKIGGCTFKLDIFDNKANFTNLKRFRNHVVVKRNGTVVWVGMITRLNSSLRGVEGSIEVECYEFFAHLADRYTADIVTFLATDAGQIAWGLIDYTQNLTNGGLGITQGTITTTVDRDRTYEKYRISDAIINLANVENGFDFNLVPTVDSNNLLTGLDFNVYLSYGVTRNEYELTMDNIESISFSSESPLINTIKVEGAGSGEDIQQYEINDSTFQIAYTRREEVIARKDISIRSTLEEFGDTILRDKKVERYRLNVSLKSDRSPVFGEISVGDIVNYSFITEESSFYNFTGTARILELGIEIDDVGNESIVTSLDFVV